MFRDGMMQTLVKDQMDIDWQAYKPVLLFLNGEYWGIHSIREKHNEHYLESNYGINPDEIDILSGNASVKKGSAQIYNEMISFVDSHDMDIKGNYDWVSTQMEINEYLNYVISEVYFANIDWPRGNIKYWREHGANNKWRWILFDTDLGFGAHDLGQYDSNTLENATATTATYYANPPSATLLLRKLLENTEFKNQFIQRFASHLNITFNPQRVLSIIDSLKTEIEPEIPRHIQKWEKSTSFNDGWNYHIEVMKEFATKRPNSVINHINGKFGLSGSAKLNVNISDPKMGDIFINEVKLPTNNFSGAYLKDIPIQLKAIPKHGYRFIEWRGISNSYQSTLSLILSSESNLEAIFEIAESVIYHGLRINEILAVNDQTNIDMYGEYDDWIELFNDSDESIDIGGMYLTNDLYQPDMFKISTFVSDSTTIQPGDFLLVWADKDTTQGILHANFKLGADGEQIGLAKQTDSGFVFIDTLTFGNQTSDVSYGRTPDGGNEFQFFIPTPGYKNIITDIMDENSKLSTGSFLHQNYPNPFNPETTIYYSIQSDGLVSLKVYDVLGKNVITLLNERQVKGNYKITFDGSQLPSGVYFYRIQCNSFVESKKMILMK